MTVNESNYAPTTPTPYSALPEDRQSLRSDDSNGAVNNVNAFSINTHHNEALFSPDYQSDVNDDNRGINPSIFVSIVTIVYLSLGTVAICYIVSQSLITMLVYITLQLATSTIAFVLNERSIYIRWIVGFLCAAVLSVYKTTILLPHLLDNGSNNAASAGEVNDFDNDDNKTVTTNRKIFYYAATALWECSNAALVVGGKTMHNKQGLTCVKRAILAGMIPSQVTFVEHQKENLNVTRSVHLFLYLLFGLSLQKCLATFDALMDTIMSHLILEAEALALLMSALILVFDVPCHLWQLGMDGMLLLTNDIDFKVQIILPYGAVYFSKSCRDFWSKWSRPGMQLIRQLVYYPLGGPRRPLVSIPLLFLINATSHYDVGYALVGDRAEKWWTIVFGVLGLGATSEVLATSFIMERYNNSLPFWFVVLRGVLAHVGLRVALYIFVHECLKMSMSSFVS